MAYLKKTTKDPLETLAKMRIPFTIEAKGSGKKYYSEIGNFYYREKFTVRKDLMYVFKHVEDRAKIQYELDPEKFELSSRPKFVHISKFMDSTKSGIFQVPEMYCIDIKSAYWKIAYQNGLCDKETFDRFYGLKGEAKMFRNMAIGNLAARTDVFDVDENGVITMLDSYKNDLQSIFWYVASKCDEQIQINKSTISGSYLFSWIDNFYVYGDITMRTIKKNLEKSGFAWDVEKVHKIVKSNTKYFVWKGNKKTPKIYNFSNNRRLQNYATVSDFLSKEKA